MRPRRRSTSRAVAIACLLAGGMVVFGPCPSPEPAAAGLDEARTAHVHARSEIGPEKAREYAALAESCWAHWKEYFDAEPPKNRLPLELYVAKDREAFLAAVRAIGVSDLPGAGGYYDARGRVSYLYPQPRETSTRLLVLHELTHQYQYKALQDDVPDRSPIWHREGLAEHFGFHRRTAAGLVVGALDMVAIDDRPDQAAERVRAGKFDPWGIGTGAVAGDYTDAMALVETLLRTKDETLKKAFRAWEREIYKGGNAARRFEKAFDGKKERLAAAAKEVWADFRKPWSLVYVSWDEENGAIVGTGMPWAVLKGGRPLPPEKRFVEAEIALGREAGSAGIGIGVRSAEDMVGADLLSIGRVVLFARKQGARQDLGLYDIPAGAPVGPVRVRLEARGTRLLVEVGGFPAIETDATAAGLSPSDLDGPAGLFGGPGEVRFTKVVTGATP